VHDAVDCTLFVPRSEEDDTATIGQTSTPQALEHLPAVKREQFADLLSVGQEHLPIARRVCDDHDEEIHLAVAELECKPALKGLKVPGSRFRFAARPSPMLLGDAVPRPSVAGDG
jgi:hypothetical protein